MTKNIYDAKNSTTVKDVSWLTFKVEARYSIRNFRDRCLMHREQPCSIFIRSKKEKKKKKRPAGVRPNSTDLIRYRSSMLERRRPHSASCPLFAVSRGEEIQIHRRQICGGATRREDASREIPWKDWTVKKGGEAKNKMFQDIKDSSRIGTVKFTNLPLRDFQRRSHPPLAFSALFLSLRATIFHNENAFLHFRHTSPTSCFKHFYFLLYLSPPLSLSIIE